MAIEAPHPQCTPFPTQNLHLCQMDVSTAVSILERMAAANARAADGDDDTMTITLRVKRRDWPERLLRNDDVDFNTAVLEKGLADDKTDYERLEERVRARVAAEIGALTAERDRAIEQSAKWMENIRILAPGPFGEMQTDNTLKKLYPDATIEVISRSHGRMDIKFTLGGVTIRFEVKNKKSIEEGDILRFRTQAISLEHDASIMVSLSDTNMRKHGIEFLPGEKPILVVRGCTPVMLKSAVAYAMFAVLRTRDGASVDSVSVFKTKLVALMHGPVQKMLDERILRVRQDWKEVIRWQDVILKQIPDALDIEPGSEMDDHPDGYTFARTNKRKRT